MEIGQAPCKQCNDSVGTIVIKFTETVERLTEYPIAPPTIQINTLDAGVFCSRECLREYLEEAADEADTGSAE